MTCPLPAVTINRGKESVLVTRGTPETFTSFGFRAFKFNCTQLSFLFSCLVLTISPLTVSLPEQFSQYAH